MKLIYIFHVSILIIGCNASQSKVEDTTETFNEFFQNFTSDSSYQLKHIEFPLSSIYYDIEDKQEKYLIEKRDWVFEDFSKDFKAQTEEQDAYQYKIRKVDNENFIYQRLGLDNGINISYYFRKEDNKWFLFKLIDRSS